MSLTLVASATLDYVPQMLWYSERRGCFIAGNERAADALPVVDFSTPVRLAAALPYDPAFPCRLPLPDELQAEFCAIPWHGFEFLRPDEYDVAVGDDGRRIGNLPLTLHYGPDYGLLVRHPPSDLILSLNSGSVELLRRSESGFERIDSTRTRGRAALCFAAHPTAPQIAYGDNFGNVHTHEFSDAGFGRASKVDAKGRNANAIEFLDEGEALLVGGTGYLSLYRKAGKKWSLQSETTTAVRGFCWVPSSRIAVVNRGMHGAIRYAIRDAGFETIDSLAGPEPIERIATTPNGEFVAATLQRSGKVLSIAAS